MTNFRHNVIDILEEWDFYTNPIPCQDVAHNSGHVQIKCFINNTCPFYKTPYKEDSIIFNSETYEEMKEILPDRITGSLTATPGVEGLHFVPRKVFRHNYMNKWDPDTSSPLYNPRADINEVFKNFNVYYKNITANDGFVVGADRTRYRAEHDWAITNSVFDNLNCSGGAVDECKIKAQWSYWPAYPQITRMEPDDIKYDYETDYYNEYLKDIVKDKNGKPVLRDGATPKILYNTVQMPVQTSTHDENANGIHWRVVKRTPIF